MEKKTASLAEKFEDLFSLKFEFHFKLSFQKL